MIKCEVCGLNKAEHICSRCHRLTCSECFDFKLDLCSECVTVKRALEKDYLNYLKRCLKLLRETSELMRYERCQECAVLRDIILKHLYELKRVKELARVEGFEDVEAKARETYKLLEKVAVKLIAKLILKLKK